MKIQCLQCLNEFESIKGAKFCSTNCRVKNHRDTIGNDTIETPEEFEVVNGVRLSYDHVCIECKEPVHPSITICLTCFTKKRKEEEK